MGMIRSENFNDIIKYPRAVLRAVFLIFNNFYAIPTYAIWMFLLLPLRRFYPVAYYWIEGKMYQWILAMVAMYCYLAGYDIVELGDDITPCLDQRTLILHNHQSTADVPLLMAAFNTKQTVLPNIMWIISKDFIYTNFGIVCSIHKDFFLGTGPKYRATALFELREHLEKTYIPRKRGWLNLAPEGGFLSKKREASHRFAKKNNLPILNYVALPRCGAMKTIIDVLGPREVTTTSSSQPKNGQKIINGGCHQLHNGNGHVKRRNSLLAKAVNINQTEIDSSNTLKYVLDITIAYPKNGEPLDILDVITGIKKPCKTHMLYRLYRSSEIPREGEALTQWLYDRFIEKEELLKNFYKTGSFGYKSKVQPTVVHQSLFRFLWIHLLFLASSYLHYQVVMKLINQLF